jgi:hypothetical protein
VFKVKKEPKRNVVEHKARLVDAKGAILVMLERVTTLRQNSYALKILEQAGTKGCNPCHVPMENRLKLSKKDDSAPVWVPQNTGV